MKHVLLGFSGHDKRNTVCMVDDGERKRDSLRWRFGRVFEVGDPSVGFGEQFVTGEEGTSVSVRSHAEQDQVEHGESSGVLLGKERDELFFVFVG